MSEKRLLNGSPCREKNGLREYDANLILHTLNTHTMIGERIQSRNAEYLILKKLSDEDRPNANVYLCIDQQGQKYVAKHFYNRFPAANVGWNTYNHYGRRRDGSSIVFQEIKSKSDEHDFIVKHIDRINFRGKWIIIQEYIEGETLKDFILKHYRSDMERTEAAIIALAKTLTVWHVHGFAHGDPHLNNAIIREDADGLSVVLIDYSQIHHRDFFYCKKYDCFHSDPAKRIHEDLEHHFGKFGPGFRYDLARLEKQLNLGNRLSALFDRYYCNSRITASACLQEA